MPKIESQYQAAHSLFDQTIKYIELNHSDFANTHGISIDLLPQKIQFEFYHRGVNKLQSEANLAAHQRCLTYNQKIIQRHYILAKKIAQFDVQINQIRQINAQLAKLGFIDSKCDQAILQTLTDKGLNLHKIENALSADIKAVLTHCKLPHEKFETMIGNTLQKHLFERNTHVLAEQAALFKDAQSSEHVRSYVEMTVKSCAFTADVIQHGTPHEAIAASKLTGVLHEATKLEAAIGKGLLTGVAANVVNTVLTGALIAACPEAGVFVLAQKIYDYAYFVQESSQVMQQHVTQAARNYQALPLDQRAENTAFYFSTLVTPFLTGKIASSIRFTELVSLIAKTAQTEYAALRSYITLDQKFIAIHKGLRFPETHKSVLIELINSGKVTTQVQVDQYVQMASGPITYLSSKCADGIVHQMQKAETAVAPIVNAAQNGQPKIATDLTTAAGSSGGSNPTAAPTAVQPPIKGHIPSNEVQQKTGAEGASIPVATTESAPSGAVNSTANAMAVTIGNEQINQTSLAILKNGYYEVNGFKFSERYYNRLWTEGRKAPSLVAKTILEDPGVKVLSDSKAGFLRYEIEGWEMVYNPTTKEVWHLQPIK